MTEEEKRKKEKVEADARFSQLEQEKKESQASLAEALADKTLMMEELDRLRLQKRKLDFEIFLNEEMAFGALTQDQQTIAMGLLEKISTTNFALTEGEEAPADKFKEFLKSLPGRTIEEEIATKSKAPKTDQGFASFEEKAAEIKRDNPGWNISSVYKEVARKHPGLVDRKGRIL